MRPRFVGYEASVRQQLWEPGWKAAQDEAGKVYLTSKLQSGEWLVCQAQGQEWDCYGQ